MRKSRSKQHYIKIPSFPWVALVTDQTTAGEEHRLFPGNVVSLFSFRSHGGDPAVGVEVSFLPRYGTRQEIKKKTTKQTKLAFLRQMWQRIAMSVPVSLGLLFHPLPLTLFLLPLSWLTLSLTCLCIDWYVNWVRFLYLCKSQNIISVDVVGAYHWPPLFCLAPIFFLKSNIFFLQSC